MLKLLERIGKRLLALWAAALLWRPRRRAWASAQAKPRRVLLVRIDDRVGEALLMTPLLDALAGLPAPPRVDVLVHAKAARVLAGHPNAATVLTFDRRRLWMGPWAPGVRALRSDSYDVIVNCANWSEPSVTAAVVSRLLAPRAPVVGPAAWPAGLLMDVRVAPRTDTSSEAVQRLHLLAALGVSTGNALPSFRAPKVGAELAQWLEAHQGLRWAVVNPGGRLGWRRVPIEAFAAAARALSEAGLPPLVTWGPGEEALAREVVASCPQAILAPPTDLDGLAELMRRARAVVCNNTGPMHLSVAVGAPTLALFLHMPMERWGYPQRPHRMVDLTVAARQRKSLAEETAREVRTHLATLEAARS